MIIFQIGMFLEPCHRHLPTFFDLAFCGPEQVEIICRLTFQAIQ